MKTIVLQSNKRPPWPEWVRICLLSARRWALESGFSHLFIQDELFEDLPAAFLRDTEEQILPRTDYGRLLWMKRLHRDGWERVIWLDADLLIFDDSLAFSDDAVGREAWLTHAPDVGFRITRKVNNCAMCFHAGSRHLDRYLSAIEAAVAAGGPYDKLAFGPDLMTRLHAEAPFPLHSDIAMFSPRIAEALASGLAPALRAHAAAWGGAPKAANLCSSLGAPDDKMERAARRLLKEPALAAPAGPPPPIAYLPPWKDGPVDW